MKFSKNLDFVHILKKLSISIKSFEKHRFWCKILKILILVNIYDKCRFLLKIFKNLDFAQHYLNYRFWSKFSKISFSVKIFEKSQLRWNFLEKLQFCSKFLGFFVQNYRKMSIFTQNYRNIDLTQNFRKSWFWSKYAKVSILVINCEKSRFG